MKKIAFLLSLFPLIATAAPTETSPTTSQPAAVQLPGTSRPVVVQMIESKGMKVERSFPVSAQLTGWVMSDPKSADGYSVMYTTADGENLIAGAVLDRYGKNLTAEHAERYIPKPDMATAFKDLQKNATTLTTGSTKPKQTFYVIADPNCGFCHLVSAAFGLYADDVQIKWIPVGFLAPSSQNLAAAALQKQVAWDALMTNKGRRAELEKTEIKPEVAKQLAKNLDLMRKYQFQGTPGVLWEKDGKIEVRKGMVRISEIAAVLGVPTKETSDPMLSRYR